jgi:hypothetical protein
MLKKQLYKSTNNGTTVTNIVSNGNFGDGTTGFVASGSVISAGSNTLSITGNGDDQYPQCRHTTTIPLALSKIVYIKFKARVTNASCQIISTLVTSTGGGGNIQTSALQNNPVQNQWYTISGLSTIPVGFTPGNIKINLISQYADAATANGKVMEIQEVLTISLTDNFGAGNEPNITECDAIFSNWFDGAIGVRPSVSLRSFLRQL